MNKPRLIPILLVKNGGLYKTQKFSNPKYIGDPLNAIRIFNEKEVDEIIILDIDATRKNTSPNYNLIEQFAGECFMPVCYGGGIKNFEDAERIFSLGIEKISIQSSVYKEKDLINKISNVYGSQAVVLSVDLKKNLFGNYRLYAHSTEKNLEIPWKSFIVDGIKAGAGEILLNLVDKDGTLSGLDSDILEELKNEVNVPIILTGGVNSVDDIKFAFSKGATAIGGGAFFVFNGPHRAVLISYPKYSDLIF